MTAQLVQQLVGSAASVSPLAIGVTADIFLVSRGTDTTVVKVMKSELGDAFSRMAVGLEVDALRAVAGAHVRGVRFSVPLRAWPEQGAYEMRLEVAEPIVELPLSWWDLADVAGRLQSGLHFFARRTGRAFGDLHLDNVLASPTGELVLIDPVSVVDVQLEMNGEVTTSNPEMLYREDLVWLTVVEALRFPRRLWNSPLQGLRAFRLTRAFASTAKRDPLFSNGQQAYRKAARSCMWRHARSEGFGGVLKLTYRWPVLEMLLASRSR